jgi:fructose transport system ATP-binding protein
MNETTPAARLARPILESEGLVKTYGHVVVLDGADFALYPDEVLAMVGDNGAGKSTLIKCMTGVEAPDSGVMRLDGQVIRFRKPMEARLAGIATMYQTLDVAPPSDLASNLFQGRDLRKPGPLGDIPRRFETWRRRRNAVAFDTRVILLDEPTAALGARDSVEVLRLIQNLRGRGLPVVFVSHNMPHVFKVADRIHVQRMGKRAAVVTPQSARIADVVAIMSGALHIDEKDQTLGPTR